MRQKAVKLVDFGRWEADVGVRRAADERDDADELIFETAFRSGDNQNGIGDGFLDHRRHTQGFPSSSADLGRTSVRPIRSLGKRKRSNRTKTDGKLPSPNFPSLRGRSNPQIRRRGYSCHWGCQDSLLFV